MPLVIILLVLALIVGVIGIVLELLQFAVGVVVALVIASAVVGYLKRERG